MSKTELHTYRNCDSSEESMRKKNSIICLCYNGNFVLFANFASTSFY